MAHQWRRADERDSLLHCPNHSIKNIFYARIYTPRAGFEYSETNQYIHNLKINPQDNHRLQYKREAIQAFAKEVTELLKRSSQVKATLIPIPTSKIPSDPAYDNRFEQVCGVIEKHCPNVVFLPLLKRKKSVEPFHLSEDERWVKRLYESLQVDEAMAKTCNKDSEWVLLDDVITSGAHFEASRRLLLDYFPQAKVTGIFWAKSKGS